MRSILILAALLAMTMSPARAWAWWGDGHVRASELALQALPRDMPNFFKNSRGAIPHFVVDPDLMRLRETPQLRSAEGPEHYFDLELLAGKPLPPTRQELIALCKELDVDVSRVGYAPYAVTEWTQRLAVSFAEYRRWPNNPYIHMKVLYQAGMVAHYAQDICQPLHTTVHFDGRMDKDDKSPGTGIHIKVDAALAKARFEDGDLLKNVRVERFDDIFAAVVKQMEMSHKLVDRVYELEGSFPPAEGEGADKPLPDDVNTFIMARATHSVNLTASLYYSAWMKSHVIKLPPWDDRSMSKRKSNTDSLLPPLAD